MSNLELDHLLQVLDDRDAGLSRDDIAWSFDSSDTKKEISAWVREYLSLATLLTREELHFYKNKTAQVESNGPAGIHISDECLEVAIYSLEASTASIEKQCRLLETQKRAIEDIIRRNSSKSDGKDSITHRAGRSTHEKAQLEFEQAELSSSLRSQLNAASKHAEATIAGMPAAIERILDKDDRLLDGLEKILPNLSSADDSSTNADEVERLCKALTVQLSADIRSQIDATYQNSIRPRSGLQINGNGSTAVTDELKAQREALQSELEELSREIDGLSSMAVENQYRIPISHALRSTRSDRDAERAGQSEYVAAILQHLTARLETMNEQFEHAHVHNSALKAVSATFEAVMATVIDKKKTTPGSVVSSPSKQSQKGLKPLRLVQANLSENQDPVVQLLKQLDVRIPSDRDHSSQLAENLVSAVKEQRRKIGALESTTERNVTGQIAESLAKIEKDAKNLEGAVFGLSDYDSVRLLDRDVQDAVDGLEEKTQRMGDEMRAMDVGEVAGIVQRKQKAVMETLQS